MTHTAAPTLLVLHPTLRTGRSALHRPPGARRARREPDRRDRQPRQRLLRRRTPRPPRRSLAAAPEGARLYPQPYIEGDVVVAAFQDEAGTPMVKRYRLAPPGM